MLKHLPTLMKFQPHPQCPLTNRYGLGLALLPGFHLPPSVPTENADAIVALRDAFQHSVLAPRIVCLLVHGSSLHKPLELHTESDIDLELVLHTVQVGDAEEIRSIVSLGRFRVECQYRYQEEIIREDGLLHQAGYNLVSFFAYCHSICLLGKNIYPDLVGSLPERAVQRSLLNGTQIAFKNVRKCYLAGHSPYEVNKAVFRFLHFLSLALGWMPYQEIGCRYQSSYARVVSTVAAALGDRLSASHLRHLQRYLGAQAEGHIHTPVIEVVSEIAALLAPSLANRDVTTSNLSVSAL